MFLLAGLGNPGRDYARNRHNIGFMAVDEIVRRHDFAGWRAKFQGELAPGFVDGEKVLALKPMTYMNRSGGSVAEAAKFFKVPPERVFVFYDELDLAPGKLRVKKGGGHGGHNGVRDVIAHLGADFWRVRLGIGHPGRKELVHGYVLHDFAKADADWLGPLLDAVAGEAPRLLTGDMEGFMSRVAHLAPPPKQESPKKDDEAPDGV